MHQLGKSVFPGLLVLSLALATTSLAAASEKVYQSVLPGTVWIKAPLNPGKASFGSGALVDAERKWVLTNYHVVENQNQVTVFFPAQKDGEVIAEKLFYAVNEPKLAIPGRVIFRDTQRDLALVQLSSVPEDARPVKLADQSAKPGQMLHVIGNPTGLALWVYSCGTVRSVYNKSWTAMTADSKPMFLSARVVETQIPINPGDSGGPVVNGAGELVALVSSYNKVQQLVSTCIDLTEIKKAIGRAKKGDSGDAVIANNPEPLNPPAFNPPAFNPFPEPSIPLPARPRFQESRW